MAVLSGRLQMRAAATIKTNAVYPVGVMDHGRCVEACLCAGAHSWLMLRSFAGIRRRKPKQTGRYALSFPFAPCQIRNPGGGVWSAISLVTSKGRARGQQPQETQARGRHACSVGLARLPETAWHTHALKRTRHPPLITFKGLSPTQLIGRNGQAGSSTRASPAAGLSSMTT